MARILPRMKLCAAVAAAVLLLAACTSSAGSGSPGSTAAAKSAAVATFEVAGRYSIVQVVGLGLFTTSGTSCAGDGSASSIVDGAPVKVETVGGKVLATGRLSGGVTAQLEGDFVSCVFRLDVPGVPEGETFYRLVVGARPAEQFTSAKLHQHLDLAYLGS